MNAYDVVVIGAGQAGLAAGYFLKQKGASFVLLDQRNKAGDIWRERYDSLVLFTPRFYSALPGLPLEGKRDGYATKDEFAGYFESYAKHLDLPILFQTHVSKLTKADNGFLIQTNWGELSAAAVIVATGPFQKPLIPQMALSLSNDVFQIHTANYRNASQLQEGPVLVVGAGNSGAQIAVELAQQHDVTLSVGHKIKFMPVQLMGKSIFWWFGKLGIYEASVHSFLGKRLRKQPDPIFGHELKALLHKGGIQLKPRAEAILGDTVSFADRTSIRASNIIWATGFTQDYGWIDIPEAFDAKGKPLHQRGKSPVAGLYFVGMPWQHNRASALIGGVGKDAEYVVNHLITKPL
ncbi:flavin-containing monooxygenase [Paenibacillus contaminans]|uniref:Oxidoreductase n=1 Tax=Paenibacillus contaminans TaxID=450362 RepID=A0A329MSY5_9BACL|nr:NAD(P)/FAD-dependent oxidoreductase [Paenibacillus contaminans]RAV23081.1 oxidoreductase [Paenibacillus contaminans]